MATPRKSSYPREYFAVFEQALTGPEPIVLTYDSYDEAQRRRSHFYAFRVSLTSSGEPPTLACLASNLTFKIDGTKLVISSSNKVARDLIEKLNHELQQGN